MEPALPDGPVNNSATLAYRAKGAPVVANNSVSLVTFVVAIFGGSQAISATLTTGNTLTIRSSDVHNQPVGYPTHNLKVEIKQFHGIGIYTAEVGWPTGNSGTSYQVVTYSDSGSPIDHASQYPVANGPGQFIITSWEPTTHHLQGTFTLYVSGPNNPQQPTELSEGRFDLVAE